MLHVLLSPGITKKQYPAPGDAALHLLLLRGEVSDHSQGLMCRPHVRVLSTDMIAHRNQTLIAEDNSEW